MPCRGQSEVNIGWFGARALRETFLLHAPDGPPVTRKGDPVRIGEGHRIGIQSQPNPDLRPDPPMRDPRQDHHWVYHVVTGDAGWLPTAHFELDDTVDLARAGHEHCGPADVDFQVGKTRPRGHTRPDARPKLKTGEYEVKQQDAKLRLAPHGTGFEWLLQGDVVVVRAMVRLGRELDYCVEVMESETAEVGSEGFVLAEALARRRLSHPGVP